MPGKSSPGHLEGPVLVSACLLGIPCRYDGTSKPCPSLMESKVMLTVPVCPEQLGGFSTPRPKAWLSGGDGSDVLRGNARVVNGKGEDVTSAFIAGAQITLGIVRALGIRAAVLKEGSPSCGVHRVTIDGGKRPGKGVTAALLEENGITLLSEEDGF